MLSRGCLFPPQQSAVVGNELLSLLLKHRDMQGDELVEELKKLLADTTNADDLIRKIKEDQADRLSKDDLRCFTAQRFENICILSVNLHHAQPGLVARNRKYFYAHKAVVFILTLFEKSNDKHKPSKPFYYLLNGFYAGYIQKQKNHLSGSVLLLSRKILSGLKRMLGKQIKIILVSDRGTENSELLSMPKSFQVYLRCILHLQRSFFKGLRTTKLVFPSDRVEGRKIERSINNALELFITTKLEKNPFKASQFKKITFISNPLASENYFNSFFDDVDDSNLNLLIELKEYVVKEYPRCKLIEWILSTYLTIFGFKRLITFGTTCKEDVLKLSSYKTFFLECRSKDACVRNSTSFFITCTEMIEFITSVENFFSKHSSNIPLLELSIGSHYDVRGMENFKSEQQPAITTLASRLESLWKYGNQGGLVATNKILQISSDRPGFKPSHFMPWSFFSEELVCHTKHDIKKVNVQAGETFMQACEAYLFAANHDVRGSHFVDGN
jgi:hypothetical protein